MTRPARGLLSAVIAAGVLVLVLFETSSALRESGPWPERAGGRRTIPVDPYAPLDALIANSGRDVLPSTIRDPFGYVTVNLASAPPRPVVRPKPAPPVALAAPKYTAVVMSDSDLQAVILYDGRNYTVKVGSAFAGYKVISIFRDHVVLDYNGQQVVLYRTTKGD